MDCFNYRRRPTSVVRVGNTPLGGIYPVRIQSMANVSTMDTGEAANQAIRMIKAGAEYVRFTAQGEREAQNLQNIRHSLDKQGYDMPLIADIHFNPKAADKAALYVEKVRINPGNYINHARKLKQNACTDAAYASEVQKIRARFAPFLQLCRENNTAIRIGVNHGSLSERIINQYGDTPEGMVESCMEFLRLCVEEQFDRVVLSIKASNTVVMIRAVRLLVRTMDDEGMCFPLHLGVTEAGDGEDGRIKSAVGIGALLIDGLGDTIRVSLSEEPEAEMPVARKIVDYITSLANHTPIRATASLHYNPVNPYRRKSRPVNGIGGDNPPIVISNPAGMEQAGDHAMNKQMSHPNRDTVDNRLAPDWVFTTPENSSHIPFCKNILLDAKDWQAKPGTFPCFSISEKDKFIRCNAKIKFINLTYSDLNDEIIEVLKTDKSTIAIVNSTHVHYIGEVRAFMHRLLIAGCDVPVIFRREYDDDDKESVQIKAAVEFGTLFTDGFGDGLMMCHKNKSVCDAKTLDNYMFGILQAARVRISKTEYISCPGCGRTLFDLQKTIAQVKAATTHLKGLKIGIMGCIVNGPGEMADADYGYVGAGRGRISLYKGKSCILKSIPEKEAVERLIELIEGRLHLENKNK